MWCLRVVQREYEEESPYTNPYPTIVYCVDETEERWFSFSNSILFILVFWNDAIFTGKLPTEVGNMAALYDTLLSTNQLSQSLPSELGRLSRLRTLCADGNRFKVE